MDIRIIIIVAIGFIVFIAMGDNPFEMHEPGAKDSPFVKRIEEKMNMEPSGRGNALFGLGNNATAPYPTTTNNYGTTPNYEVKPLGDPEGNVAPYLQPRPAAPEDVQPSPFRGLPPGEKSSDSGKPRPLAMRNALQDGTRIAFLGPDVFKVGASGEKVPLADGKYALEDGTPMYVRGGRQQIPPYFYVREKPGQKG